jgi:hypothetical protein
MFSLDNLAIQYPHAEVERVPPSQYGGTVACRAMADISVLQFGILPMLEWGR